MVCEVTCLSSSLLSRSLMPHSCLSRSPQGGDNFGGNTPHGTSVYITLSFLIYYIQENVLAEVRVIPVPAFLDLMCFFFSLQFPWILW